MHRQLKAMAHEGALAIGLLLGLATLGGCGFSDSTSDAEHVSKAKDFQEKGDTRASIIELKSALQKNPENAEARRLLGEEYVRESNGPDAEKELKRAIELGVAREAVLLSMAEALQLQGKSQEILDEIDAASLPDAKDRSRLNGYRGNAWLALNKPDKAKTEYQQALHEDPDSGLSRLGLARIAAIENEIDQAIKLVEEVLQADPKEATAWSFKAELHKRKGELEKAESSYTQAIALEGSNEVYRANRALVQVELGKLEAAAEDIGVLKKEAPQYFLTHFADGYLKIVQNKFPEAQGPLEEALKLNDRYPFTLFYLGLVHLAQNHVDQADQQLTRFKTMAPNAMQAHQMLALVKFKQRDYQAARALLMPVILSQPEDVFSLNLMGNIESAAGNTTEGLKYLEKVAELKPTSATAKARLGAGLMAAGQREQGLEALEAALEKDPQLRQPELALALAHIRSKEFKEALDAINRLKEKTPDHPTPFNLEAMLYAAQGDEGKAKVALEHALALSPGDPTTSENLARLAYKAKRLDEVRRLYEGVLQAHPDHPLAQLRLSEIDYREGKFKAMEERLTTLIQKQPELLQPRLELARYWLSNGQANRSQTLLEEVRPRSPDNPDLLMILTEVQIETKQELRALETAKALEKIAPKSAQALYMLSKAYGANKDAKNTRAALERSLKNDPKFPRARIAMVKLLTLEKKESESRKAINQLTDEFPEDPEVAALRGWWASQQRKPKEAVEAYGLAFSKQPTTALVMNLAQAQWQTGNKGQALKTLEEWNKQYPNDASVHHMRSGMYSAMGKLTEAKGALQRTLELDPKSLIALNDLAWLIRDDSPRQALEYAEKAHELGPKQPQVIDTLAMVLIQNNQLDRALLLLRQAAELAPNDPSIRYHLAITEEKSGLKAEAIATLKQALATKQSFRERREAEVMLTRLTR